MSASGGDEGKMRELLLDTAKSLGLNTDQPEVALNPKRQLS